MRIALNRRSFLTASAAAATLPMLPRMAHAATPFAMQAAWINDAEFAGYFIAMDQGYYTAEGLDLTYLPGGPDVIPEATIVAGSASYASICNILADAPGDTTTIVDAWFGFQPAETLTRSLTRAGVSEVFEIWCHAPPDVIGDRYAARINDRPTGHPGADDLPALDTLATRGQPVAAGPVLTLDTTTPLDLPAVLNWLRQPHF